MENYRDQFSRSDAHRVLHTKRVEHTGEVLKYFLYYNDLLVYAIIRARMPCALALIFLLIHGVFKNIKRRIEVIHIIHRSGTPAGILVFLTVLMSNNIIIAVLLI